MESGAEQLRDWMTRRGFNQRQAAEYFGWDETFISQLLADPPRQRKPGLTNAIKIEREAGIPVEAWVSSELDEAESVGSGKSGKRQSGQGVKRNVR